MTTVNYDHRRACYPGDVKNYDTTKLRDELPMKKLLVKDEINLSY